MSPGTALVPRQPGRWRAFFRLSLRTLLLLVVLVAVWLGVTFNRVRQQRAAVARIEQLGGSVQYSHERDRNGRRITNAVSPGPPWLRTLLGREFFETVVSVNLNETAVTDADMRVIGKLRGVASMNLRSTSVSDSGLGEIHHWRNLGELWLSDSRVTGAGMRHLAGMPALTTLDLARTAVDDDGVAHLRGHRLVILCLSETHVTSEGIVHLRSCQELVQFLMHSTQVDDTAVPALLSLPKLDMLDVAGTKISGRGLLALCKAWPEGQMVGGHYIDVSGKPDKKRVYMSSVWQAVAERACALDGEDRLKLIDVSWSNIQDDHLAALHRLRHVEIIDLRGSDATPEGADALRKALPHCEVRY